ncbi:MAG TPA: ATP-binding protein [Acidobacteriota bacterium]|nr:ATP-binding protein [Acidobacteriota bacterium]
MAENDASQNDSADLRKRAEERLQKKSADLGAPARQESWLLLHELQVHQIELEMQNEELRRTQIELEASRAMYFDLYDLAPVGYMTLSEQGLILEANLTTANLLGVDRSQLVKQPVTRFIVREDEDVYYLHRKHLFETGARQVCEIRFRRKDGSRFWTRLEATMVQDGESKAPACRVAVSDITEYKRLEQERQAMEAHLRHQQKLESIGRLAGGVAHEINNPLTGIMGYAQLIAARIDKTSPLVGYASEIIRQTERVATIVRNLLTFARHETQSHSPADIHEIIGATLALIQTAMPRDQITLELDIPQNMPRIKCRSQQIQQVLMNLLSNARDALDEKYPECNPDKIIRVTAQVFEKAEQAWIRTTVEDHGTGISLEIQEKMFDPFFTTKEPGKGTGLGLAISHGIVEEHGGELYCESEPGQWTRFHLDLPVDKG